MLLLTMYLWMPTVSDNESIEKCCGCYWLTEGVRIATDYLRALGHDGLLGPAYLSLLGAHRLNRVS